MSRGVEEQEYITGMRDAGLVEEDFSDDELGEMYREAIGESDDGVDGTDVVDTDTSDTSEETGEDTTPEPLKVEGFKVYLEDKEVEDIRSLAIDDLIAKATLGYNALGKEQRKTLAEVVRNAQLGHLNAQRYEQLESDLTRLREIADTSDKDLSELRSQSEIWDRVLQQAASGNLDPLQKLVDRYAEAVAAPTVEAAVDPRIRDYELESAGREVLEKEIRPYLQDLGKGFGYEGEGYKQLEEYVLARIGQIPRQLQTAERVQRYLVHELPAELEANKYANPVVEGNVTTSPDVVALKDELETLRAELKKVKGDKKLDEAPPGSGSASSNGVVDEAKFESDGDFDIKKFKNFLSDR